MIIPLGIAAFIVFYVVFRIAITKFDLKTPGREDDDLDEENITLANDDFTAMAAVIQMRIRDRINRLLLQNT